MNILEKFLSLTSKTYPHGTETEILPLLPNDLIRDEFGNYYKQIGENPQIMFTCHLDTANKTQSKVNHVIDGNIIKTDGTTILGADDKAGVTILLFLIERGIHGLYYFFIGEEVGCIGSTALANYHKENPIQTIKKVISFDRRGYDSVITHQMSSRCCSENFGLALASAINEASKSVRDNPFTYKNDPTGVYTDSAKFTKIYPECTNISVGYNSEHTHNESQDIRHLEDLCKSLILIDWDSLPVERDPSINDIIYSENWDWDWYEEHYPKRVETKIEKKLWFIDNDFGKYLSFIKLVEENNIVSISLSEERLEFEMDLIENFLNSFELDYESFYWDGVQLDIEYTSGNKSQCDRVELTEFIEELGFWKELVNEHLK